MPSFNRLLAAFSLLSVSGSALGIYDPTATTTKAPNRQEAVVLPWYLSGNYTEPPDDGSRSPKRPISLGEVRKPVTITAGTKNWSEWRKAPGSDLEQRTELSKDPPQTETSDQDRRRNHPNGFDQDRHQPGRYDQDRPGRFDRDRDTSGRYDQDRPGRYDQDRPGRFDGDRRRPGGYDQDSDNRSGRADRHRDPPGRYDQDSDDRSGRADRHRDPPGRYDQDYDDRNRPGRGYPGRHDQDEDRRQSDRYNPNRDPSGRFDRHHPGMFDQDHPGDDLRHEDRDCHDSSHQPESNLYEGVPVKPHKENLLFSTKPKPRIARYDPLSGAQCPEADSTGQFVFPPDCKFFVNCWQGRAFVQPCAPGTLFNPETLECDFPHKVNCYGNEFAESPFSHHLEPHGTHGHHLPSARTYDKETLQNPKCPPHVTGLLPHPGDCTKFLQCANGGTFIKDCGPGTVFNPAISVCDWPYNVRGCEDAMKKKDVNAESPLIPPKPNSYEHVTDRTWTSEYSQPQPKKPECPTDYVGLLPHPDTCKKFLQCANGITFVMDCGPGTAFNPETSVCDWPHKVPGCSKDKSKQTPTSTTTTWPPRGSGSSGSWHTPPGHRGRDPWSTGPPVITPTVPTYPDNTGYFGHNSHTDHTHDYDNRYSHSHNVPPGHPRWQPSGHRPGHPNRGYDDRTEGGWTRETIPPDGNNSGNGYGDHNHHDIHGHHGHHDLGHPVYGHEHPVHGHEHPGRGHENYPGHHDHRGHPHQYPGPYDIPPQPDYGNRRDNLPSSSNQNPNPWVPARGQPNSQPPSTPWNYPIYSGSGRGQPNVQVTGSAYNGTQPPQPTSSGSFGQPGSPGRPIGVTTGHGNHGGTVDGYPQSGNNNWTSPTNVFNTSTVSAFWLSGNKSVGIPSGHLDPQPEQFVPSSGSPQAPNVNQSQGRQWQQEEPPFPVYYVPKAKPLNKSQESTPQTPISGQVIRLRGDSGPRSGYLEVQGAKPGWGVVCDSRNGWTLKEAHVICRQLGYSRGAEMAWQGRNNRKGMPTWIAANSVACLGNETRFQSCKFTHNQECRTERDAVGVSCLPNRVAHCRKDEISHEGQCYHLAKAESGMNHAKALEYCTRRMARLIDITSQAENNFVSEWLLQTHPEVDSIMTSGVGFTTLSRTIWLWEDSSRAKFTFTKWWPGWLNEKQRPPQVNKTPTCIVMKRKYPCHDGSKEPVCVGDYFFWDAEDCSNFSEGHAFICKRPYDDIGCVYGKGNQYIGKANVTSSGKECLPWADERVAHPLNVNVVNREVREKLKTHNYCRNPNPHKESRPWCFTGLFGEREHCDIPSCGKTASQRSLQAGQCEDRHFECMPGQCIPSIWVCDGAEDCTNGADEKACSAHLSLFKKSARQILEGYDVEKWLHTPLKTCAHRCKVADFTCRSFAHNANSNICLLSDKNVGMTGALKPTKEFDYYELIERSMNCDGMFVCNNRKCINLTQVCNGKNDCNDRSDESICTVGNLDYAIRLAGSNNSHEGRVEVKVLGHWGQVCDDGFGMINADVICKELGFGLGALEVRTGGFYGNMDPPDRFMVDQLRCRGNETSMRECDFEGWGVHNCQPEEAVGVVCKTAVDSCQQGHWKCDNSPACIPTLFICDEVVDCPDGSDENAAHCDAPFEVRLANGSSPLEGRVEVRHHGVWGTVCDDDFTNTAARVICRSLGYGGMAVAKKNGYFGPGQGPIWLDEVFCHGNESQLYRCDHSHWGQHNCDHNEDAGVICKPGDVNDSEFTWEAAPDLPEVSINDLLPAECGKRAENFNDDEDFIFAKVVHGSVAPKGTYPWQASIRVRGHSRSSHWCGAVILSPLHVLTAAHCLEGYNKGTYFVRAGDYNTEIDEGTEAEANIEDYYVHNEFRKGHRMNNDIALVLLKGRGIPLGRHIMPICLPAENAEYPAGLNCTISGFGSIETGKSTQSRDLRYGWIPLLDQSICRAGYVYGDGAISDGMVCAGHLDEGADTCDGDSGGPLACYHNGAFTLYGITSWGQHCGKANKPGVYTRVAYYRKWIDQKIRESLAGR